MSDLSVTSNNQPELRCPICDSRVQAEDSQCRMCGAALPASIQPVISPEITEKEPEKPVVVQPEAIVRPATSPTPILPAIVQSRLQERQSRLSWFITLVVIIITVVIGVIILQNPTPVAVAIFPTLTSIPPTTTYTPTWTPIPSETLSPTFTPTLTLTPRPTETPRPPAVITVAAGDTLFTLSFRFQVSIESIAQLNNLSAENPLIQAGQSLIVPYPTSTPPLTSVEVEIGGEIAVADPTDCERYQIQQNDTLLLVAGKYELPLPALLAVNRLSESSLIRPGDTVCIPHLTYTLVELAELPMSTLGPTPPPSGPCLLYPPQNALIDPPNAPVALQWVAIKDLAESEWYMVEVLDTKEVDGRPHRAFTRQTSFQLPSTWRPPIEEPRPIRWRVSIVQVTGERTDGAFTYTYGGESSINSYFTWVGAIPTPTPTPTPTITPTPFPTATSSSNN